MKNLKLQIIILLLLNTTLCASSIHIQDRGTDEVIVKYKKYGEFSGIGTQNYRYSIKDVIGLANAMGEGIYPNETAIRQNPKFRLAMQNKLLTGSHWDFVHSPNLEINYFKWASCSEEKGVKLYFTALILEQAGEIERAIKTYYALVVLSPKSTGWTFWGTPWYLGPASIHKINYLIRNNPQIGLTLENATIKIKNCYDNNTSNDIFIINPGELKKSKSTKIVDKKIDLNKLKIIDSIGKGNVKLKKYENLHWQLFVDNKPFVVKGITYTPNKINLTPDLGTLDVNRDWMFADFNNNGIIDAPFEAWVDKNRNNIQDEDEKNIGDFQLMKDMGVNTLRLYHYANLNKELLQKGYEDYGFMYLMGNFIGMYAMDSGASWETGTDYTNPKHVENMLKSVHKMVEEYKDKPYILMWVLGNENNYAQVGKQGFGGANASIHPEAYYQFVEKATKLIKSLDNWNRPIAISNGDILYLDLCFKYAPSVDVYGVNSYRGETGFGNLWLDIQEDFDKPVLVTEYGCSAYHKDWTLEQIELGQAKYHKGNWLDIASNTAGYGQGNALGGVVFEWLDEWWKSGPPPNFSPNIQDKTGQFIAPFLDGWSYEEFLGITSQGDGSNSPFLRQLRQSYFVYKKLWNQEDLS